MIEFEAHELTYCYAFLEHIRRESEAHAPGYPVHKGDELTLCRAFLEAEKQCIKLRLPITASHADRAWRKLEDNPQCKYSDLAYEAAEVRKQFHEELKGRVYLHVPSEDASYYRNTEPFGDKVALKLGKASSDIEEASKCLALDRPTAAVFHLMRVMEYCVQRMGKKLGYKLAGEKEWHKILTAINQKVENLPQDRPSKKRKKEQYAQISAHLYNIKMAWRNPVMHPRAHYDGTQAREIFNDVKRFAESLAAVI